MDVSAVSTIGEQRDRFFDAIEAMMSELFQIIIQQIVDLSDCKECPAKVLGPVEDAAAAVDGLADHGEVQAGPAADITVDHRTYVDRRSHRVLELILDLKAHGLPIVLISHNMPHVFEVADLIHIHHLGKRLCVINPKDYAVSDAVAFMSGANEPPAEAMH